jgi:NADH dehydrogenase
VQIAVTGANGAVGRAVLRNARISDQLTALVRSEQAARAIEGLCARVGVVAYAELGSLERAFERIDAVVHLPGILVERRDASHEDANVQTTRAALAAAKVAGVRKFVLVSAHGANPGARNRYYRTKGRAERLVRDSGLPFTILRAPLVLGPGTEGARALVAQTARPTVWLVGGGVTRHRPLDVDDLARAALAAARDLERARGAVLELAGPNELRYRDLVAHAAALHGREIRVRAIPAGPLRAALRVRRRLLGPGFDADALDVLLDDTRVDPSAALSALGIALTPLAETLRRSLGLDAERAPDRPSTRA